MIMLVMTVAPALDPTASTKTCTKEGGEVDERSMSPGALIKIPQSMPNARQPLMKRLSNIDLATSVLAFLTSSDICDG
jgi:hypothetical protein